MPITVKVKETGLKKARKIFKTLGIRTANYEPVFKQFIKFYQKETIIETFDSRGSHMGKKWPNLKAGGESRLRQSDRLYNAAKGGPGWFDVINPLNMEMGVQGLPYLATHQYGRGAIPQRAFFFTPSETLDKDSAEFLEGLTDAYLDEGNLT